LAEQQGIEMEKVKISETQKSIARALFLVKSAGYAFKQAIK
jgi:hypothetical protein